MAKIQNVKSTGYNPKSNPTAVSALSKFPTVTKKSPKAPKKYTP